MILYIECTLLHFNGRTLTDFAETDDVAATGGRVAPLLATFHRRTGNGFVVIDIDTETQCVRTDLPVCVETELVAGITRVGAVNGTTGDVTFRSVLTSDRLACTWTRVDDDWTAGCRHVDVTEVTHVLTVCGFEPLVTLEFAVTVQRRNRERVGDEALPVQYVVDTTLLTEDRSVQRATIELTTRVLVNNRLGLAGIGKTRVFQCVAIVDVPIELDQPVWLLRRTAGVEIATADWTGEAP